MILVNSALLLAGTRAGTLAYNGFTGGMDGMMGWSGSFWGGMMSGYNSMMNGYNGMMNGYSGMMSGLGFHSSFMQGFALLGFLSGIMVILGAVMFNTLPLESIMWGAIVLVFSIISFLGMGGFFIGAVLGITGGALALSWRPTSR